ncbi:argininosuccinate synthase [Methanoplanus sp. FWC-SCC4]|uniref:Argininosuccinate synthase n=1 Tax=Methanochimaera problematica TaxID=2609417 RepID=A0AA97I515_9EURY|nr:argininosuccinate synthase [Methanoplanus sp. FWC-SCC4]WOF16966.1 argininosuccinate synthase [Methanoplanus sp. FWC-SCC4]
MSGIILYFENQLSGLFNLNKISLFCIFIAFLAMAGPCFAATQELSVIKYGEDGNTVLFDETYDYKWLEQNLPVMGDGVTHYYMQGPTFDENDPLNPSEDKNVLSRDYGAVKGTNVADLCELAGRLPENYEVRIASEDGFSKKFGYKNVYYSDNRQGPLVVCWYNGDDNSAEGDRQGTGYPPDFYTGMRLVVFGDTDTNPWGYHVFGNQDMNDFFDEKYIHYFNGEWPSSGGLSVKYVSKIEMLPLKEAGAKDIPAESKAPLSVFVILGAFGVSCIIYKKTR